MHYDIIEAAAIRDYTVYLKFSDGLEGLIKLDRIIGKGEIFSPLTDKQFFCKLRLEPGWRTISWPNGADLAPDVLYDKIKTGPGPIVEY